MSISYTPTYYSLPGGRSTCETTLGPVASTKAFYQEKQSGHKCVLHSLNAFAGHRVVDFTALAKTNNDFYLGDESPYLHHLPLDVIKQNFCLDSIDDLEKGIKSSLDPVVIQDFISQNKQLFHLPATCQIMSVDSRPLRGERPLPKAIHYIDTHPSIHRVLGSSTFAHHDFAFRKDASGQWRVIDSWEIYHNTNEQDPIKRLQPAFPTFQEALASHLTRLKIGEKQYSLIYPTEDTPSPIPSNSPAEEPETASNPVSNSPAAAPTQAPSAANRSKQSCLAQLCSSIATFFAQLWAGICALFCRRG